MRGWAFLSVCFVAACTLAPIDESIKSCPCAPGYVCDEELTQTCARPTDVNQDCVPAITVTDFDADWATQNSIHWRWTPVGDPDELLRYELHIVPMARRYLRRVVGPEENSELGDFLRRSSGITDELVDSITYEHEPNTEYIGRLVAIDRNLCEFRSDVRGITTLAPPTGGSILLGDCAVGSVLPETMQITGRGGDCVLEHVPLRDPECDADDRALGECGQNLKWNGFPYVIPMLTENRFHNAVFEVVVANETNLAASWGRIWIVLDGREFEIEPMTVENSRGFRTLQAPLDQLRDPARNTLDYDTFIENTIVQANVGGGVGTCGFGEALASCRTEGVVRIDEFRIVY